MSLDVFHCFSIFFHHIGLLPSWQSKRTSNDGPSSTFAGFFSPTSRALSAASMPLALKIHIKKVRLQIVDLLTGKMRSWHPRYPCGKQTLQNSGNFIHRHAMTCIITVWTVGLQLQKSQGKKITPPDDWCLLQALVEKQPVPRLVATYHKITQNKKNPCRTSQVAATVSFVSRILSLPASVFFVCFLGFAFAMAPISAWWSSKLSRRCVFFSTSQPSNGCPDALMPWCPGCLSSGNLCLCDLTHGAASSQVSKNFKKIRSCLWVTSFLVSSQLRSLFFLSLQFLQWISVSTTPRVIWWHPTNTPQCHTLSSAFAASFASACRVQHGTIHWVELIYGPSPWQLHQLLVVPSFEHLSNEAHFSQKIYTNFSCGRRIQSWVAISSLQDLASTKLWSMVGCRLLTTVGQRMQGYANVTCATRAFVCVLPRSIFSGRFCCLRSRKKHITIYHVSGTLHLFK